MVKRKEPIWLEGNGYDVDGSLVVGECGGGYVDNVGDYVDNVGADQ